MQIETTMSYHLTGLAAIKQHHCHKQKITGFNEDVEKSEPMCCTIGALICKMVLTAMENNIMIPQKIKSGTVI